MLQHIALPVRFFGEPRRFGKTLPIGDMLLDSTID